MLNLCRIWAYVESFVGFDKTIENILTLVTVA